MRAQLNRRALLLRDLHQALERQELLLHFQPVCEAQTGAILGAEALLRWRHADLGMLSPAEFIPLAEESGLIHAIGDWVLEQAAQAAAALHARHGRWVRINVNVSGRQLTHPNYGAQRWLALMQSNRLTLGALCMEITESTLVENSEQVRKTLTEFHEHGILVALDDFGTGFSSLAYLKRFDIDVLKIDASFVRNLRAGSEDQTIIEAVVAMAHALGIKTTAEGWKPKSRPASCAVWAAITSRVTGSPDPCCCRICSGSSPNAVSASLTPLHRGQQRREHDEHTARPGGCSGACSVGKHRGCGGKQDFRQHHERGGARRQAGGAELQRPVG